MMQSPDAQMLMMRVIPEMEWSAKARFQSAQREIADGSAIASNSLFYRVNESRGADFRANS
jgi:hypothetical protein